MKKLKKIGIGFGILLAVGVVGSLFSEEEQTKEVVAEQEVSEKEVSEQEETERKEFEEVMEEVQEQRDKKEEEREAEKEKELAEKEEELKKKEEELAKIEEEKAKEEEKEEKENKEKELVEKEEQVLSILEENFDQVGKVEFNKEHKNYTIIPTDPNLVSEINLIAAGVFPEDWDNMVESFVELSNSLTNQLGSEYSVSLTNPANHENILILVRNGVLLYDVQNDL